MTDTRISARRRTARWDPDAAVSVREAGKRLRTTSQYLAVAVFGSEQDRAAFREAVDGAHRQVISTPGTTLQVTDDQWPATRAKFDTYWDTACQRVVIDEPVRDG